jgi:hypothetical protein
MSRERRSKLDGTSGRRREYARVPVLRAVGIPRLRVAVLAPPPDRGDVSFQWGIGVLGSDVAPTACSEGGCLRFAGGRADLSAQLIATKRINKHDTTLVPALHGTSFGNAMVRQPAQPGGAVAASCTGSSHRTFDSRARNGDVGRESARCES